MPVELVRENSSVPGDPPAKDREPKSSPRRKAAPPRGTAVGNRLLWRLLVFTALCLAAVWFWTHSDLRVKSVLDALRGISTTSLFVALCFAVLQILLQTGRFAILVPKSLEVSWLRASRVTAVGQVLNVAVPARG